MERQSYDIKLAEADRRQLSKTGAVSRSAVWSSRGRDVQEGVVRACDSGMSREEFRMRRKLALRPVPTFGISGRIILPSCCARRTGI